MTRVEGTEGIRVQEQPWWTSGSRYALAFLVLSNVAVLLTIFVPELSHWQDRHLQASISRTEQAQQRQLARASRNLEALNRQVEITRLLFDHFFGRPASEQTAVVRYLRFQFPQDLRKKSLQAILVVEAKQSVAKQITRSVAAVQKQPVGQTKVDVAVSRERAGFELLAAGDLARARKAFLDAYAAYPTYHNVDEISHVVLTETRVRAAARETPTGRRALKNVLGVVLTAYGWGIPADLRPRLQRTFDGLP